MLGRLNFYRWRRRFSRVFGGGVSRLGTVAVGESHRAPQAKVRPFSGRFANFPFFRLPQTRSRRFLLAGGGFLAFMLPIVIASLLFSNQADANWFDDAYGFRQRVPVANSSGSTQTDFQVELSLDTATLVTAGKLQSDCDDLRFTARDGKVLNYWLEPNTCNTATTKVFVKVPSIPTSGADIFWYYGNAGASTASRTDGTFIAEMPAPVAAWPLDETTATQSYARVVSPGEAEGRELVINGGFDADASWNKQTGWAISGGLAVATGPVQDQSIYQSIPTVGGKAYQITYTISNYSSGAVWFALGGTRGTQRSANGTYTEILIPGSTTNFGPQGVNGSPFYGSIDDVSVKQLNIPSSSTVATNLLTDGDMEASGTTGWTALNSATLSKQTTSPFGGTQVLRVARNGATTPSARQSNLLTVGTIYRISGYVRSDGSATPRITDGSAVLFTGTTSTSWQSFDVVFKATNTSIDLGTTTNTGTQYVEFDSVVVSNDTTIRSGELLQDGNMEAAGTSAWTAGSGAVISKQTTNPFGGSQVLRVTRNGIGNPYAAQNVAVIGKRYRATGYMRSDGNAIPFVSGSSNWKVGTNSTDWQYFDVTVLPGNNGFSFAASTTVDGQYVEFDSISVTEVSPLVGLPTNGVTLGASSGTGGHLATAYSFDGTNDNVNIYSSDLNSVFNPDEGTLVAWAKVSGAGVWTDGTTRYIAQLKVDNNNYFTIYKSTYGGNPNIGLGYASGGVSLGTNYNPSSPTGWFQVVMTWSKSGDQVKTYFNGSQVGLTATGLGTWSGNIGTTGAAIGSSASTGSGPWSGLINDVRLYDRALSSTEVASLYSGSADIQAYNTSNYTGKDLLRKFNAGVTVGTLAAEEIGAAPVAYWKFDEGQGQTVQDSSGHGNSGTLGASTSSSTDDPTWITEDQCVSWKCLQFDGTGDKVAFADNDKYSVNTTNKLSVFGWIKLNDVTVLQDPITKGTTGNYEWAIRVRADGTVSALLWDSAGNDILTTISTSTIEANEWYYVGFTTDLNSTNLSLYINGQVAHQDTTSSGSYTNGNSAVQIGERGDGNRDTTGFVDEVKIYPYTRSAVQVKEDFNQGAAKIGGQNQTFLSNGLVGYWKMDETSWNGTAAEVKDASGNGNHGVRGGNSTTIAGKFSNSGTFDGTGDYVNVSHSSSLSTQNASVAFWIKTSDLLGDKILLSKGIAFGDQSYYFLENGGLSFGVNGVSTTGISEALIATNTWHHVVGTYDGDKASIFLDGQLLYSRTGITPVTNTHSLGINSYGGGNYSAGTKQLDELRIYNRALSPAEVADLYNYAPGPVGHWKFDEGTGTTAVDSSGNGNNGTLTNGPTWSDGKFGNGVSLTSVSNEKVLLPSNPIAGQRSFTLSLWANRTADSLTALWGASAGGEYWRSTNGTNAYLYLTDSDCSNGGQVRNVNSYLETGWHYYTLTMESDGTLKHYRDGKLVDSVNYSSWGGEAWDSACPTSSYWTAIGNYSTSFGLGGKIDDAKVYNYARTPQQILEDMGGSASPSIAGNVLPDPIAHYKLDEQSGQTANNAGSGGSALNGTLGANSSASTDDPTWKTNADCKVNGCASFDNSTLEFINIGDNDIFSVNSANQLTGTAWAKSSSLARRIVIGKGNSSVYEWEVRIEATGQVLASVYTNAGSPICSNATATGVVATGQFYHYAYSMNLNGNCVLYINGKPVSTVTASGTYVNNIAPFRIGARGATTGADTWSGEIDDVKIYNVALTEDQVRLDMNAGSSLDFGAKAEPEASLLSDGAGAPPVAEWKFDEKQGTTANDSGGNGNTGTLTGTTWGLGKIGSAASFNGGDYINGFSMSAMSQFTAEAWVKVDESFIPNDTIMNVFGGSNAFNYASIYNSGVNNGKPCWYKGNGWICATSQINDNEWHHVVYQFDNGAHYIWVDGKKEYNNTLGNGTYTSGTLQIIGAYSNSNRNRDFSGNLDHIKIYNYARTPAQIAYDFNRGAPIAHWKLDECQGSTINDSSGNGNAGTLTVGGSGSQTAVGTCDTAGSAWANGASGKYGASMNFDGNDDGITIADTTPLQITNGVSLCSWTKTPQSTVNLNGGIFEKTIGGTVNTSYLLFAGGSTYQFRVLAGGSHTLYSVTSVSQLAGAWAHICGTYDASTGLQRLYINGEVDISATRTPAAISTGVGQSYIGNLGGGIYRFNGQIDDVRVYNYALSPEQVATVKNEGAAMRFGE